MGRVILTGRGRRRILGGHPWIYRDEIAVDGGERGELLPVHAPDESLLGWGFYSTASRIAVRLVTRSREQPDRAFWRARIARAVAAREKLGLLEPAGACRLLAGDADGIPGLVVDRYADVLVMQSGCQGADRMRDFVLELVDEVLPFEARAVLDRSDTRVRRLEDLNPRVEWLRGGPSSLSTDDDPIVVEERVGGAPPTTFEVAVLEGHKTGHYLDQRENRVRAAAFAKGARVLDAFSYDGLFGIRAAQAGAREVLCLDQSAACGERLARNAERNGVADRVRFEKTNAMLDLKRRAARGERFDLVVVDPPAFARNRGELAGAARGYRDLNSRALRLVEPGGVLVTCSCSFNVRPEQFLAFLGQAAHDAGRETFLLELSGAAPDHPYLLTLPETGYLECAVLRVGA
ncbi:MAG: class I SAM-dependent rRNA methyltransferase [Planctomycetota bacterium]|nr:class I SAM-dependent rRNA methyltransferase [Planctomycetota bacterium]